MYTYILKENVLTDNELHIAPESKTFKGGYIAIIEEWFFQNVWSDKKEVKDLELKNHYKNICQKIIQIFLINII